MSVNDEHGRHNRNNETSFPFRAVRLKKIPQALVIFFRTAIAAS
jgi:hypothetical protein